MTVLNDVILASASPRRVDLLRSLGFRVDVRPTAIAEGDVPGLTPRELAAHHSGAKCDAALGGVTSATLLVTADTVVDLDGRALGKPRDVAEAGAMLHALNGREHLVHTAIDVVLPEGASESRRHRVAETTAVRFFPLGSETIAAYAASRDGLDKAGAYGIQGVGAALVERIEGDFYTVMGFPLGRFVALLGAHGFAPPALAPALSEAAP